MTSAEPSVGGPAGELAAILAGVLGVSQVDLGAGFFDDLGADSLVMAKFCAQVRKRTDLPNVSMKDVYRWRNIMAMAAGIAASADNTAPAIPGATASPAADLPGDGLAARLADLLAQVLGLEQVDVQAHFFDDLGADSMTMAKFCARARKHPDLPKIAMKDIYHDPTIADLVRSLATPADPLDAIRPAAPGPAVGGETPPAQAVGPVGCSAPPVPPVGRLQYFACGAVQIVLLLSLPLLVAFAMVVGDDWLAGANGAVDTYLRAVAFAACTVLAAFALPLSAKWLLIGRWKPTEIRLWSWGYLRFWIVKSLVQRNPLVHLLSGSPLLGLYLRALGAKVGRGTTIFATQIPVCTDLLTIGADTIIRTNVLIPGYHAEAGVIRTGRVTIGDRVVIGARSVLDIDTRMGDDSRLGHSSALYPGQSIPAGQGWHGCPARPGEVDFRPAQERGRSRLRRAIFATFQLLNLVGFGIPLGLLLFAGLYLLPRYTGTSWGGKAMDHWSFWGYALVDSAAVFLDALLVIFPLLVLVSRVASRFVRPGRVYPLHGWRHTALRLITRVTNMKFYGALAADCSLVVHHLGAVGWRLKPFVQTGTNFGTVTHDYPFAVSIGKGTVVADGLAVTNVEYSASTFRVMPVAIGAANFLGNNVVYPVGGRTGDNCLLATMVMVPTDGPVREGVGLLGSPSFEIPRTVARDHGLAITDPAAVRRGVRAKNRHNTVSVLWFLLVRWFVVFATFVAAGVAADLNTELGGWAIAVTDIGYAVALFAFYLAVERLVTRYASLAPDGVSIYDKAFWRHERYWKVPYRGYLQFLSGTPLKSVCWRLLGARIGKRLFDEGAGFSEKCFLSVGDFVTMNVTSTVQNHSQEDGAFKSDRTRIGSGVTLGVGSFIHYGVTIENDSVIGAASFLMKGEQVPASEYWGGNPAQPMDRPITAAALGPVTPTAQAAHVEPTAPTRGRGGPVAYAAALAAAGTPLTLDDAAPVPWRALGALAWLVALSCLGTSTRRSRPPRGATKSMVSTEPPGVAVESVSDRPESAEVLTTARATGAPVGTGAGTRREDPQ